MIKQKLKMSKNFPFSRIKSLTAKVYLLLFLSILAFSSILYFSYYFQKTQLILTAKNQLQNFFSEFPKKESALSSKNILSAQQLINIVQSKYPNSSAFISNSEQETIVLGKSFSKKKIMEINKLAEAKQLVFIKHNFINYKNNYISRFIIPLETSTRGILQTSVLILIPADDILHSLNKRLTMNFQMLTIASILLFFIYSFTAKLITWPLQSITASLKTINNGNLKNRLVKDGNYETSELIDAANLFLDNVQKKIDSIARINNDFLTEANNLFKSIYKLHTNNKNLEEFSALLAVNAKNIISNLQSIANASDEVATQMHMVAYSNKLTSQNLNGASLNSKENSAHLLKASNATKKISSLIESLTIPMENIHDSLRDTIQKSRQGIQVSNEAFYSTVNSASVLDSINSLSKETSEIIGLIKGISSQTNLLALSSTIESQGHGKT
ncbi:hypothetical protein ACFLZV_02900, partial [Candidatus Margulisiibacteriota bacterium]